MKNILLLYLCWLFVLPNLYSQTNPSAQSLFQEGIALYDEGKYEDAIQKFEKVLALDKKDGNALYEAGNTYIALKDYKKALEYADRILKKGLEPIAEAYVLKGNALDMLEKPDKAIEAYREGIKRSKPYAMLHFNLGISLLRGGKSQEARPEFEQTLTLDPSHLSSHYCLGLSYSNGNLIAKTLLPLYKFLMLENKGQRAEVASKTIQSIAKPTLKKEGNQINISINPAALGDEFGPAEMLLALYPVAQDSKRQTLADSLHTEISEQPLSEYLTGFNKAFFETLDENDNVGGKAKAGFWWDTYGHFFVELHQKGHTEAFTNYLLFGSGNADAKTWLITHKPELEAFSAWFTEKQKQE